MDQIISTETRSSAKPNILRTDRNLIYHYEKVHLPELPEMSHEVLTFFAELVQTKIPDLIGFYHFTAKDFITFSQRSKGSVFKESKNWEHVIDLGNGKSTVLKSVFEQVLMHYLNHNLPLNEIYLYENNKRMISLKKQTLLTDFLVSIPNGRTKQRHYAIEIHSNFFNSILKEYLHINIENYRKIRGKTNPLVVLTLFLEVIRNESLRKKLGQYRVPYPIMKNKSNINIDSENYSYSTKVSRTHDKIKNKLNTIKNETDIYFDYLVDSDNAYVFNFIKRPIPTSKEKFRSALNGTIRTTIANSLKDNKLESIVELSTLQKEELLLNIMYAFDLNISKDDQPTYQQLFIQMVQKNTNMYSEQELKEAITNKFKNR